MSRDELRAESERLKALIDEAYWIFTRSSRGKPPSMQVPRAYRRRNAIKEELRRRRGPRRNARRRTSRRRTSRRVRPNEKRFEQQVSPLDYEPSGYPKGAVKRLAVVDTDAPPPDKPYPYFVERERFVHRSPKTGRTYKKPRRVVEPGAGEQTVAFLDYYVWGQPGDYQGYINYMATRGDQRGRGLARELVQTFMRSAEQSGVTHVNFGRIMSPAVWKLYEDYRERFRSGQCPISVSGKRDF